VQSFPRAPPPVVRGRRRRARAGRWGRTRHRIALPTRVRCAGGRGQRGAGAVAGTESTHWRIGSGGRTASGRPGPCGRGHVPDGSAGPGAPPWRSGTTCRESATQSTGRAGGGGERNRETGESVHLPGGVSVEPGRSVGDSAAVVTAWSPDYPETMDDLLSRAGRMIAEIPDWALKTDTPGHHRKESDRT
jgi:hypothetical protein